MIIVIFWDYIITAIIIPAIVLGFYLLYLKRRILDPSNNYTEEVNENLAKISEYSHTSEPEKRKIYLVPKGNIAGPAFKIFETFKSEEVQESTTIPVDDVNNKSEIEKRISEQILRDALPHSVQDYLPGEWIRCVQARCVKESIENPKEQIKDELRKEKCKEMEKILDILFDKYYFKEILEEPYKTEAEHPIVVYNDVLIPLCESMQKSSVRFNDGRKKVEYLINQLKNQNAGILRVRGDAEPTNYIRSLSKIIEEKECFLIYNSTDWSIAKIWLSTMFPGELKKNKYDVQFELFEHPKKDLFFILGGKSYNSE